MTDQDIAQANAKFESSDPLDIARWAVGQANGRALVSTNFRPYEAVILHLATQVQPDITVLWVDHGYNKPATYVHAQDLIDKLKLNVKLYVPKVTPAYYDALNGGAPDPTPENEERIKAFSKVMKLEPFQRGMRELAPTVWLTALRRVQNPNRAGMQVVENDKGFNTLKVSPLLSWTDKQMNDYCKQHNLPVEWDYFDPAKADDKRECGLHIAWGKEAVAQAK
ncbi:MAG: phosphoadenosine phosphosulfate reductase family protein [Tepidisphaeraceae bacterium]